MRPLSEPTARIAKNNFSRKYVALGRIISQWNEIISDEFAHIAQPIKINYRKAVRGRKPSATLDIATSSSFATILPYQKGIILERINKLFGNEWITDIRFVASNIQEVQTPKKKIIHPLTRDEKDYLSNVLSKVDDVELKEKLENLGKLILRDEKNES